MVFDVLGGKEDVDHSIELQFCLSLLDFMIFLKL
jgi:hypothetical protein